MHSLAQVFLTQSAEMHTCSAEWLPSSLRPFPQQWSQKWLTCYVTLQASSVVTTVTFHATGFPFCRGTRERSSGCLPSVRVYEKDRKAGWYFHCWNTGGIESPGDSVVKSLMPRESSWCLFAYESVETRGIRLWSTTANMWDTKIQS